MVSDITSDAQFRAWCQWLDDLFLVTGGWTLSSDTGQMTISTVTHPTAGNTAQGYRIYCMSDALQSTAPIFLKIEYGSSTVLTEPSIWFTIGQGSNGSGTITNVLTTRTQVNASNSTGAQTGTATSYGSAAPNRCSFAMFINATNMLWMFVFGIERTKDSVGNDTAAGFLLVYKATASGSSGVEASRYVINAVGTQPSIESGLAYIITHYTPSQTFTPGDIGVGVVIHFKGVAQQPGINWLVTNNNDVSVEGFIDLVIYGTSHRYQQLNILAAQRGVAGGAALDTNSRMLMRYD